MITCPLCEHQQARGDECEACGKKLTGPGAGAVPVARLDGLEPTALFEGPASVPLDAVPGLEPTRHEVADAAEAPALTIEPTLAAPVEVVIEMTPGLEPTAEDLAPDDAPAGPAPAPICRYCRTPAFPGEVICGRCGMKLPLLAARPAASGTELPPETRCHACGTMSPGSVCSGCGTLLRRG
jgi:hypothetical protein